MADEETDTRQAREGARYALSLPVAFAWKDDKNAWQRGAGLTRDISTRGAFILVPEPPPSGATLEIEAYLPWGPDSLPACIFGKGRVVRAEPWRDAHARGFAVDAVRFVLRRGEHLI